MQAGNSAFQAEKQEVQWLLESGVLGRSTNLSRMFQIVCEKYFENPEGQIKEYTIAVEGLGRAEDFDPHIDPVVRVTAHLLRKRLKEFYAGEGGNRPLHVLLPLGRYSPQFILRQAQEEQLEEAVGEEESSAALVLPAADVAIENPPQAPDRLGRVGRIGWWVLGLACMASMLVIVKHAISVSGKHPKQASVDAPLSTALIPPAKPFRMLVGAGRAGLNDRSGNSWAADSYCIGGESFTVPSHEVDATVSPEIFLGGRRGMFHCAFPVTPGTYELHLYFADTRGTPDASHSVVYSINGGTLSPMDVVDTAPGSFVATARLIPNVSPRSDGKIHVDFKNNESFVNAIELLPANGPKLAPIRIAAADRDYIDSAGQHWLADRFYSGGRRSISELQTQNGGSVEYSSGRVGHFTYSIPVEKGAKYTVRLHFIETWFGNEVNAGHRLFDVTANGIRLLKDFDIYAEANREPLVKTFKHIEPNGLGKIEIGFDPVSNYAVVCAIEVEEE